MQETQVISVLHLLVRFLFRSTLLFPLFPGARCPELGGPFRVSSVRLIDLFETMFKIIMNFDILDLKTWILQMNTSLK